MSDFQSSKLENHKFSQLPFRNFSQSQFYFESGIAISQFHNLIFGSFYNPEKGRITFGGDTPSSGYKSGGASEATSSGHLSPSSNHSGPNQFDETRFDCGDFSREKTSYRSTRSDVSHVTSDDDSSDNSSEPRQKTPIQFYSSFSVEPCLLVFGGKPKKPVFKRENLKLFKIDL